MSAPLSAALLPCVACLSLACGSNAVGTRDAAPTAPSSATDAGAPSSHPDDTQSATLDGGDRRMPVQDGFGQDAATGGEVLEFPFHVLDSAECLDLSAGTWSPVDPMPRALHGLAAAGYRGKMYVFGGAEEAASATPRPGAVYVLGP